MKMNISGLRNKVDDKKNYYTEAFNEIWQITQQFEKQLDPKAKSTLPNFDKALDRLFPKQTITDIQRADLPKLEELCKACTSCSRCDDKKSLLFGLGCKQNPLLMIVSDKPLLGEAGTFLGKWLSSINLSTKTNAYYTLLCKCVSPSQADVEDYNKCSEYLKAQISLLRPKAILAFGEEVSKFLSNTDKNLESIHGKYNMYNGVPLMCTYDPIVVLQNPALKRPVWEDLKKLASYIGTMPNA